MCRSSHPHPHRIARIVLGLIVCASIAGVTGRQAASLLSTDSRMSSAFLRLQNLYYPIAVNHRLWDSTESARRDASRRLRMLGRQNRSLRLQIAGIRDMHSTMFGIGAISC